MAMKVTPMTKVRITGPKSVLTETIQTLHELEMLHLISYAKKDRDYFDIGVPLPQADGYAKTVVNARALLENFQIKGNGQKIKNIEMSIAEFENLNSAFYTAQQETKHAKERMANIESQLQNPVHQLNIRPELVREYKSLQSFIGMVNKFNVQELKSIARESIAFHTPIKDKTAVAIFTERSKANAVQTWLRENGFQESKMQEKNAKALQAELLHEQKALALAEKELGKIESKKQFLLDLEYTLTRELKQAEAPLHFATTLRTFIIRGWIPTKKLNEFNRKLEIKTREQIHIEIMESKEEAPIELQNPHPLKFFEFFLNLYSLPKYYELDPTILIAITFPFFYGFMLGDVGYGLISLIIFYLAKRKMKGAESQALLSLLMAVSVSTILFGFIFGEFFGYEFIEHPILNRVHDINTMFMITGIIGIIHVNMGLVLGFYNKLKEHGFAHALMEKGSWIIMEIGVAVAVLMPALQLVGAIIAVMGLALLYKGEGFRGLIELPSLPSNILSYVRLFGLGFVSVQLALIVNQMAGMLMAQGILGIIGGILVLILGHSINLFLGILGPFIQSLRLHYVEFFTKFYEGGGQAYVPFGESKK